MNLFFLIDDHTDLLNELNTSMVVEASMDALMNPDKPRPEGESIIGEVTRQYVYDCPTICSLDADVLG